MNDEKIDSLAAVDKVLAEEYHIENGSRSTAPRNPIQLNIYSHAARAFRLLACVRWIVNRSVRMGRGAEPSIMRELEATLEECREIVGRDTAKAAPDNPLDEHEFLTPYPTGLDKVTHINRRRNPGEGDRLTAPDLLCEKISNETGIYSREVRRVIVHFLTAIADEMGEGRDVSLPGFGRFKIYLRKMNGAGMQLGEYAPVVVFRPMLNLRKRMRRATKILEALGKTSREFHWKGSKPKADTGHHVPKRRSDSRVHSKTRDQGRGKPVQGRIDPLDDEEV